MYHHDAYGQRSQLQQKPEIRERDIINNEVTIYQYELKYMQKGNMAKYFDLCNMTWKHL